MHEKGAYVPLQTLITKWGIFDVLRSRTSAITKGGNFFALQSGTSGITK